MEFAEDGEGQVDCCRGWANRVPATMLRGTTDHTDDTDEERRMGEREMVFGWLLFGCESGEIAVRRGATDWNGVDDHEGIATKMHEKGVVEVCVLNRRVIVSWAWRFGLPLSVTRSLYVQGSIREVASCLVKCVGACCVFDACST